MNRLLCIFHFTLLLSQWSCRPTQARDMTKLLGARVPRKHDTMSRGSKGVRTGITARQDTEDGKGVQFDSCFEDSECNGDDNYYCNDIFSDEFCGSGANCVCKAENPPLCFNCKDCVEGGNTQTCTKAATNTNDEASGFCASVNGTINLNQALFAAGDDGNTFIEVGDCNLLVTPSPDPSRTAFPSSSSVQSPTASPTPGTCIDANALDAYETVFHQHRQAVVLCDMHASCATHGHMVEFEGVPMSMKTYCEQQLHVTNVKCVKRIIHVNSPKFKRNLRIQSKTKGLVYTALAASYQTRVEEFILKAILKYAI